MQRATQFTDENQTRIPRFTFDPEYVRRQRLQRTGIAHRAHRRSIHGAVAARLRHLNVRHRAVAQDRERDDHARRRGYARIHRRLQPVAADSPLHRFDVPRKSRPEITAARASESQSRLRRSRAHRKRRCRHRAAFRLRRTELRWAAAASGFSSSFDGLVTYFGGLFFRISESASRPACGFGLAAARICRVPSIRPRRGSPSPHPGAGKRDRRHVAHDSHRHRASRSAPICASCA